MIQYMYALDSVNKIHHISEVTSANRYAQYFCPGCRHIFIPRLGKIREHHFAHKHETSNCSFESYLHEIAKYVFYERFQFAKTFKRPFLLKFWQHCSTSKTYRQYPGLENIDCSEFFEREIDLAQYFEIVEMEKQYEGFRPDLRLYSTKHDCTLLIEIKVTHGCSEEKIASQHKILEIEIQSQEDLWRLKENALEAPFQQFFRQEGALNIILHHFPEFAPEQLSAKCLCRERSIFGTKVYPRSHRHRVLLRSSQIYWKLKDVPRLHQQHQGNKSTFLHFDVVDNRTVEECKSVYYRNLKTAERQGVKVIYKRKNFQTAYSQKEQRTNHSIQY